VDNPYADLVSRLNKLDIHDPTISRRLNELVSINEILTTLNTARTLEETLDILLLTILGEYGCHRGAVFVKTAEGWQLGIGKGLRGREIDISELPRTDLESLPPIVRAGTAVPGSHDGPGPVVPGSLDGPGSVVPGSLDVFMQEGQFELLLPVRNERQLVGLICLGRSILGPAATQKESLLATISDFGGVIIGNSLYRMDLEQVNRQLQRRIFQLNTLYELTGAFARCYENEEVFQILSNNLMGQFFISRAAVLEIGETCSVTFSRGLKLSETLPGEDQPLEPLASWPADVTEVGAISCPAIAAFMREHRLEYALPIRSENLSVGLLLLGRPLDGRLLADADREFILSLSQQSAVAVENVRLQKEEAEKKRMEKELQLAREIQQKLLPKDVPVLPGYALAVEMRPYTLVGGDFYDFIPLDDQRLGICVADVSGKSLPASMIMSTAQATLRALHSFSGLSPKDVVEKLNIHMYQSTQSNKFLTMFYAVLDPARHQLTYINAGHNRPILVCSQNRIQHLDKGGMVIGMFRNAMYQVGEVCFEPGTELLIYTDGLSEVTNPEGEEFGDDRLEEVLCDLRGKGAVQEEKDAVVHRVMHFSRNNTVDDMTVLLIRRLADGQE